MATRQSRADRAERDFGSIRTSLYDVFNGLFCRAVDIDTPADTPRGAWTVTDVIDTLYSYGCAAYDRRTGDFLPFSSNSGRYDQYGYPIGTVRLHGDNGTTYTTDRANLYLFFASPTQSAIATYVRKQCDALADIDIAIKQNLDAIKTITIISGQASPAIARKAAAMDAQRRKGNSVFLWLDDSGDLLRNTNLQLYSTGATYHAGELQELYDRKYNALLRTVGISTPTEKAERLITAEAEQQAAESDAYIDSMIAYCNQQSQLQGAPFTFRRRQSTPTAGESENEPQGDEEGADNGD